MRVLCIDDDQRLFELLASYFAPNGVTLVHATDGAKGLAALERDVFDAVLLDVMMPEMSGIETLRQLRLSRSISDLPVIMVTADHTSADVAEALDLGANDYVTTPIDFPIVLARIRTQTTPRRGDPMTGLPNRTQFMDQLVHAGRVPGRGRLQCGQEPRGLRHVGARHLQPGEGGH